MRTIAMPKLALTAAAAVGLYTSMLGLPLPESCAAPSPSCGGDLRECLRQSADLRQTTFGGRYVTAEDVARCVDAFNSCTHGGAGGSQVQPGSTSPRSGNHKGLPQSFALTFSTGGSTFQSDCRVNGDTVNCTATVQPLPPDIVNYEAGFTGTVSGMTVTGTETSRQEVRYETGCISHEEYSAPYTYTLEPNGSVTAKIGVGQRHSVFTCSEPTSGTTPAGDVTGSWSPIG